MADDVGDVITATRRDFTSPPPTLDECWRFCCEGVYRLQHGLLVIVDVPSLIQLSNETQDLMKEVL
jgi:purine-binding chemotaxis protein CheW